MPHRKLIVTLALATLLLVGLALAWRFTPLADYLEPQHMAKRLETLQKLPGAPFYFVAAFVIGGLVMFPVTVLSASTAIVFAPYIAAPVSFSGILLSAALLHWLGARLIGPQAHKALGPTIQRVDEALADRGIVTIAAIRMMPIAPFTLVNLAAGAIAVPFRDYMLGTILGIAPGTILVCLFGRQVREFWRHPSGQGIALVIGVAIVWIAVSLSLQRWASHRRRARSTAPA
ncbi:MAG TPA: VTT domain-containing protein [Steroidobacteraceae bacterium]|jgi:phospholipase D1/2|nr:VTT domain-containing protein [Steroidobacteraceae bacterium]